VANGDDSIVGIDIGGANLKLASVSGRAVSQPFAIWREPGQLSDRVADMLTAFAAAQRLAITMTAELADCFPTKADGVREILAAIGRAAPHLEQHVWTLDGHFRSPHEAATVPELVAAANWHGLATWIGRRLDVPAALLIDIGTTTTDIIPIRQGRPATRGLTDPGRLQSGELVYTGISRTPVCAVAKTVRYRGKPCRVCAELFATTRDVFLVKGDLPEAPDDHDTADSRPATRSAAHARLARMIGCDTTEFTWNDAVTLANDVAEQQLQVLQEALGDVLRGMTEPPRAIVLSGSGTFLAQRLVISSPALRDVPTERLDRFLSAEAATAACAYAIAHLARDPDA